MRKFLRMNVVAVSAVACVLLSSGCTLTKLKDENKRLTEANGKLRDKYGRLEKDYADIEGELAEKNREVAGLKDRLGAGERSRFGSGNGSQSSADDFRRLGLESETTAQGTVIRLDQAVFFSLGKASLSSKGKRILSQISGILNSRYDSNTIRVEGHTDDTPVRKVKHLYPTNWELSTARACSVVRYLVQKGGVSPYRVYPAGFSFYKPRARGTTSKSRSKNRRVEILILNQRVNA